MLIVGVANGSVFIHAGASDCIDKICAECHSNGCVLDTVITDKNIGMKDVRKYADSATLGKIVKSHADKKPAVSNANGEDSKSTSGGLGGAS